MLGIAVGSRGWVSRFASATCLSSIAACTVTYDLPSPVVTVRTAIQQHQTIALAPVTFVEIGSDGAASDTTAKGVDRSDWVRSLIHTELQTAGLPSGNILMTAQQTQEACVRTNASREQLSAILASACGETSADLLMCHQFTVRPYREGSWQPTGFVAGVDVNPTAGTGGITVRSVIRECKSGREIWRGEVLARTSATMGDPFLRDTLRRVYSKIQVSGGGK